MQAPDIGVNAHHVEWIGSSIRNLYGRAERDHFSSSGCEQMVEEPTHIDGGVLDFVPADFPYILGIRAGSPVGTSDHSAVFYGVVLEQPTPHLVCRQDVYLKNYVNWELARGDVKGFN